MRKVFGKITMLCLILSIVCSCATYTASPTVMKRNTAPAIGCRPDEIQDVRITDTAGIFGVAMWTASCRGKHYLCGHEGYAVKCTEQSEPVKVDKVGHSW
jgi:hypothetical protein